MATDEAVACWAALVAYVQDIHQPQFNLTEPQWQAARRLADASNTNPAPRVEDEILATALHVMFDELDPPGMDDDWWRVAERMLTEYTALVEA